MSLEDDLEAVVEDEAEPIKGLIGPALGVVGGGAVGGSVLPTSAARQAATLLIANVPTCDRGLPKFVKAYVAQSQCSTTLPYVSFGGC